MCIILACEQYIAHKNQMSLCYTCMYMNHLCRVEYVLYIPHMNNLSLSCTHIILRFQMAVHQVILNVTMVTVWQVAISVIMKIAVETTVMNKDVVSSYNIFCNPPYSNIRMA